MGFRNIRINQYHNAFNFRKGYKHNKYVLEQLVNRRGEEKLLLEKRANQSMLAKSDRHMYDLTKEVIMQKDVMVQNIGCSSIEASTYEREEVYNLRARIDTLERQLSDMFFKFDMQESHREQLFRNISILEDSNNILRTEIEEIKSKEIVREDHYPIPMEKRDPFEGPLTDVL